MDEDVDDQVMYIESSVYEAPAQTPEKLFVADDEVVYIESEPYKPRIMEAAPSVDSQFQDDSADMPIYIQSDPYFPKSAGVEVAEQIACGTEDTVVFIESESYVFEDGSSAIPIDKSEQPHSILNYDDNMDLSLLHDSPAVTEVFL